MSGNDQAVLKLESGSKRSEFYHRGKSRAMKKLLGVTLGIMTALGGFVDLGQIVFTTQAGALFGYRLLWTIVLGTVGIILYMEMCGRVAVVAGEPVFAVVRTPLGNRLDLATLVASNLLNLITCAAEIGVVAIILHFVTGWPERAVLIGSGVAISAIIYLSKFQWIERSFGSSREHLSDHAQVIAAKRRCRHVSGEKVKDNNLMPLHQLAPFDVSFGLHCEQQPQHNSAKVAARHKARPRASRHLRPPYWMPFIVSSSSIEIAR
jgi:hypothetical protein